MEISMSQNKLISTIISTLQENDYGPALITVLKEAQAAFLKIKHNEIGIGVETLLTSLKTAEQLKAEELILAKILIYPMLAYGYHLQDRTEEALVIQQGSIEMNNNMPEQLHLLQIHKVQQSLNICRLYAKMKKNEEALHLARQLALYLLTGAKPETFNHWDYNGLKQCPTAIIHQQFYEVADEIIMLQLKLADSGSSHLFYKELKDFLDTYKCTEVRMLSLMQFMELKNAFSEHDKNLFLQKVKTYFENFISPFNDIQRFSLLIDVLATLKWNHVDETAYEIERKKMTAILGPIQLSKDVKRILEIS